MLKSSQLIKAIRATGSNPDHRKQGRHPDQKQIPDLYADPGAVAAVKQTDDFFIEFAWNPQNDLHQITLCSMKGTIGVTADKQYLLSLANNIHAHLQQSDMIKTNNYELY